MGQKFRLLYLNLKSENRVWVTNQLDGTGDDYQIEHVGSWLELRGKLAEAEYDLVLTDEIESGDLPGIKSNCPPFVMFVDDENENVAVTALEQGRIADYVLCSQSGFQRLSLTIRAVLAREKGKSLQSAPNTGRLRLFTQLRGNYDAMVVVDQNGKVTYQSKDSVFGTGYSQDELQKMNPLDLIHKSDADFALPLFYNLIGNPDSEEDVRLRILHKDGSWHWYEVSGINLLQDPRVRGILIRYSDVTKRKQDEVQQDAVYRIAQAALVTESLDDLFSSIHMIISEVVSASNFYIALYDAENDLIDFPYYQDKFDEPPTKPTKLDKGLTAFVIRAGQSLLCDRDRFIQLKELKKVALVGTAFAIWLGVPLIIGKQVIGVMGIQDYENENAYSIKDQRFLEFVSSQVAFAIYRKQTEVALRESESRFRSLFENSTIGIYRSTPAGRLLLINPALLRITGYTSYEELVTVDLSKSGYVNPKDRIHFQELLKRDGEVRGLESAWMKKDGSAIYVRESARIIRDEKNGEIYYEGIVEDISERKKAEEAIQEKIVALETLAEIDKEILLAKDSRSLLELVCRRSTNLLKASKACIASIGKMHSEMLAVYGFQNAENLMDEFSREPNLKIFNRWPSFAIHNLARRNFPKIMARTRINENVQSVIAESFEVRHGERAVLAVFDIKPREWSVADQQYLKFLVGQIAISLEKANLLDRAEYRAKNFELLYSLSGEIASRRDLENVLNMIVESVLQLFDTRCGFIYLYDEFQDCLELTHVHGVELEPDVRIKMGEGMAGRVAKTRKPRCINDYRTWRYRNRAFDIYNFSLVMEVPMIYRDQLIGVLAVADTGDTLRTYSNEDVRLLTLFASQAAGAVYNAKLFSEIRFRTEELDRLYRALGSLIAHVSSDRYRLSQGICEIVLSEFNHSNCSLWLVNNVSFRLERFGIAGVSICDSHQLAIDEGGLIPKAVRDGVLVNVGDVRLNEDYLPGWSEASSELVIPLKIDDQVIGAIDLQSAKPFAFNQDDERLMTLFAMRAALMLEHVRLVEQTEERNRRLDLLHAIETSFASNLDLRIALSSLIEQIQSRLNVDAASVYIYESDLQMLEYIVGRGFTTMPSGQQRIRIGVGLPGKAALEQEIIYIPDLTQPGAARQGTGGFYGEGFVSNFIIPLVAKGELRGILELFYRQQVQVEPDWIEFLETLARQIAIAIDGIQVFDQLQRSLIEQQIAQDATIEGWSRLLELRGLEPEGHAQRVIAMTLDLAQRIGIEDKKLASIYRGVLLHDIGKLLIPDIIVQKCGPLTDEEWELVRLHPVHAHELLSKIAPFRSALSIPYCHHEYWDGSGYPRGLKGEQIPLEARIFQVVETWDLMRIDLPYRKAFKDDEVIEYIQSMAGKRFDKRIVEKFVAMIKQ